MSIFNMVASMNESTVVSEYIPKSRRSDSYQSEADLEKEFIRMLTEQGYEYLQIHTEAELIVNLRKKIEQLNSYHFTDTEWKRFFNKYIANANEGIVEKTRTIQEDAVKNMERDDGSTKNITLLDKKNIHNNRLQVLNQYEVSQNEGARFDNRYDMTILVNGFPLIHVELKRRGVAIREAFNQINRYQRDSFFAGSGLYEYVQIFVISNGTHTKYYSNTTRSTHIKEQGKSSNRGKRTSNSFEFTSFWADANNKVISDFVDFTKTFLSKHTILNVLTKYCVFTSEELLLVMRPYQIAATEKILNRIEIATNYKKLGTLEAGGYIWHTTGSGKTLTSFKTAQLASRLDFVDKVLFVVDRKDLDYQTMKEYDRFQKGAANSNTSTVILKKQLENDDAKIIITTIQKLDNFIRRYKGHEIFGGHIVLVFDECHRSQFGDMHTAITKNFKNYHIFDFTGTPIFADNAVSGKNVYLRTTPQVFGDKLHTSMKNDRHFIIQIESYMTSKRIVVQYKNRWMLDIKSNLYLRKMIWSRGEACLYVRYFIKGRVYYMTNLFSLNDCYEIWKKNSQNKLNPLTLRRYTNLVDNHLLPYFENIAVRDITEKDIKIFLDKKQKDGMAEVTRNMIVMLLKKFFRIAEIDTTKLGLEHAIHIKQSRRTVEILEKEEQSILGRV